MSRSRFDPGKTTTAAFISGDHLDAVILNDGVGEQLLSRLLQGRLRLGGIAVRDFDIEHLALANARDAIDAERLQRALDCLPLWIEHAGLQSDSDTRFHRSLVCRRKVRGGRSAPTASVSLIPSPAPGRCPAGVRPRP